MRIQIGFALLAVLFSVQASAKSVSVAACGAFVAATAGDRASEFRWEPGYIRGIFADGTGTFDLLLGEDGTAFFRAETEDGVWAAGQLQDTIFEMTGAKPASRRASVMPRFADTTPFVSR